MSLDVIVVKDVKTQGLKISRLKTSSEESRRGVIQK